MNEAAPTNTTAPAVKLSDVKDQKWFAPDNLEAGAKYVADVTGAMPTLKVHYNFDPNNPELAQGFGLLVQPMFERNPQKDEPMLMTGLIVAACPPLAVVAATEKGAAFLHNALLTTFGAKLKSTVRQALDNKEEIRLPDTLDGFLEQAKRSDALKAFNEIAAVFVKVLKKRGLRSITPFILRSVLSSKAFAENHYGDIPQEQWALVNAKMSAHAASKGFDPTIYKIWADTRDETTIDDTANLDLSDLAV